MLKLTPADFVTSTWSGGTTTQLAIAPDGAVYAERSFLWRVSSATVELETSDFTPLPDYNRLITTLQGEIDLSHDGGDWIHLRPFDVHRFDGAVATSSRGRCTDFNLMLRKGRVDGSMEAIELRNGSCVVAADKRTPDGAAYASILVYCLSGKVLVRSGSEQLELSANEAVCEPLPDSMRLVAAGEAGKAIVCKIWYL